MQKNFIMSIYLLISSVENTLKMDCKLSNDKENMNEQDCTYEYCEEDADVVLIDLVKNFPFLYDKSATDFKNAKKKECTWMDISVYLKLSVTDCQNKWQRLREKFSREKKRRELET